MESKVETLFTQLDAAVLWLSKQEEITYLDALVHTLHVLPLDEEGRNALEVLDEKYKDLIMHIRFDLVDPECVRKVISYCMLKSFKGTANEKHLITPDAVSFYVGYLVEKLAGDKKILRILDPVVGTSNMLTALINQISKSVDAYGADIDETMLAISVSSADLQKIKIEYFHQDSVMPLLLDPVDFVIADLPVGYYPDDARAKSFKVSSETGHTFAHHLLIEQSLNYVKPSGYVIAVVPNHLFSSEQSLLLQRCIHEMAKVVGLLELPHDLFNDRLNRKSLLILQKKDGNNYAYKEALMAQLPSFKDMKKTESIIVKLNNWFLKNV